MNNENRKRKIKLCGDLLSSKNEISNKMPKLKGKFDKFLVNSFEWLNQVKNVIESETKK